MSLRLCTALALALAARLTAQNPGDFFEPGTPFLRSSLTFPDGEGENDFNRTRRGVIVPAGNGLWACFDPDLLRIAAVWREPADRLPITLESMPAISYPDVAKKAEIPTSPRGEILLRTPELPGFSHTPGQWEDPRLATTISPPHSKLGPLPPEVARWEGLDLRGGTVVLRYRIGRTQIQETLRSLGPDIFLRQILVSPPTETLRLTIDPRQAELLDTGANVAGSALPHLALVTSGQAALRVHPALGTFVEIPPAPQPVLLALVRSAAPLDAAPNLPKFPQPAPAKLFENQRISLTANPEFTDQGIFASRLFPLPQKNTQKRHLRPTSLDFLPDGTAYVTTFDGDVWRVDQLGEQTATWTRAATGLYEPMVIRVGKQGEIYVFGRDQITRLIDINDDGIFDIYQNASDAFLQTLHSRDFAMSMELGPGGEFYIAKGGIWFAGLGADWLNELAIHRGTVLQIDPSGNTLTPLADGLRIPFVGLDSRGRVFASDQQGNYIPSTPVFRIGQDRPSFGHDPTNFRHQEITEPLLWFPYVENHSASAFATLSAQGFPSLPGQFSQLSWNGFLFPLVAPDEGRAFAWKLPVTLPVPILNATTHPTTGHLFMAGFSPPAWNPTTAQPEGLAEVWQQRGGLLVPTTWKVESKRQVIHFAAPLPADISLPNSQLHIAAWNIIRSREYGSGHYHWDGSPGTHRFLPLASHLSDDRKTLVLETPPLFHSSILELKLQFISAAGTPHPECHMFTTVSDLPAPTKEELAALSKKEENIRPGKAALGPAVFTKFGCMGCHTTDGSPGTGPSLKGVASRHPDKLDAYLRESILDPAKEIVPGFDEGMPSFEGIISAQELEDIVTWLKTL